MDDDPEWEELPFYVPDAPVVFEGGFGNDLVFEGGFEEGSDDSSLDDEFDLLTLTIPAAQAWDDEEEDDGTVVVHWEGEQDNESDTDTVSE